MEMELVTYICETLRNNPDDWHTYDYYLCHKSGIQISTMRKVEWMSIIHPESVKPSDENKKKMWAAYEHWSKLRVLESIKSFDKQKLNKSWSFRGWLFG